MFDIGFAELMLVAVVGLLVIGPERLPEAIRTGSAWINTIRRSFNEVRADVRRELHNDAVLRELKSDVNKIGQELQQAQDPVNSIMQQAKHDIDTIARADEDEQGAQPVVSEKPNPHS